ncbi:PrpF domain-containing protein [Burkholderia cepacia]|nr:PrpF domain-containing protein [Burkholderia cepacia]
MVPHRFRMMPCRVNFWKTSDNPESALDLRITPLGIALKGNETMNVNERHAVSRGSVIELPVHHMRGGTSTGLVLWRGALPSDESLLEELLRHLMGVPLSGDAPGNRQITGLGRGHPTTNKVFLVEYDEASHRITSTLAQLAAEKCGIDWGVNCGNMSAALPLFAYDVGWLSGQAGDAEIDIHNTNTNTSMRGRLLLTDGQLESSTEIPGVNGRFPGVDLFLHEPTGAKTGKLFPTGAPSDRFGSIDATCLDVAVPMVIALAKDFGKTGHESPEALDADAPFKAALRELWVEAGLRMRLRHRDGSLMSPTALAQSETMPKVCIVSPPLGDGHIAVRYFTPQSAHPSLAVSGGCCLASACLIEGTVAQRISTLRIRLDEQTTECRVALENPAGVLEAVIKASRVADEPFIAAAAYRRSAQILLRGTMPLYRASPSLVEALMTRR